MSVQEMSASPYVQLFEALRIVSLPVEIQTTDDVYSFLKDVLLLTDASIASINVVPMQTETGVRYRTAFVDVSVDAETVDASEWMRYFALDGAYVKSNRIPGGIHFDNGKPMSHLKLLPAKRHSPSTEPLALGSDDWTSIYIPTLPDDLTMDNGDMRYTTEEGLSEFFESQLKVGRVSRVDFMSKQIPGTDRTATCAYVHFDLWYDNHISKLLRKVIAEKGEFTCNGYYNGFEFCAFDRNRFIKFKVNHKPIPAATEDLNIHQLAARVKMLEEQNADLIQKIENPLTMEESFNRVCIALEDFKQKSEDLVAEHGSVDEVKMSGILDTPEYEQYKFDHVVAFRELVTMFRNAPSSWV